MGGKRLPASRPGGCGPGPLPDARPHLGRGRQRRGRALDPADHGGPGAAGPDAGPGRPAERGSGLWRTRAFGTGLLTPYAGTVFTDGAARTYRLGTRWTAVSGLSLTLEGRRQESPGQQPVNQGLQLQIGWGF